MVRKLLRNFEQKEKSLMPAKLLTSAPENQRLLNPDEICHNEALKKNTCLVNNRVSTKSYWQLCKHAESTNIRIANPLNLI